MKHYNPLPALLMLLAIFHVSCADVTARKADHLLLIDAPAPGSVAIVHGSEVADVYVSEAEWPGVCRAARDLCDDIERVTGRKPRLCQPHGLPSHGILAGTIGRSPLIDSLVAAGRLDVSLVVGQWESYVIETVDSLLVIAGSDKRGTIYGIYELSQQSGVSPWYWWADAPVVRRSSLIAGSFRKVQPSPKVKYRGIFINDEWPSFGTWSNGCFGGQNARLHERLFELLLRLRANYYWPAMWDNRFNEDDPDNPRLADEMGIVMGTSHHEPMMRAHKEYTTRREEVGPWDFASNPLRIEQFFRDGIERNKGYENLITIGMRGDGDVAMGAGNDADNMLTLGRVIDCQRRLITEAYGRPASEVPQLWAIFTEVQRYYDAGFTVPDDVTLLLCDNNWGYIRRIGREAERRRSGGLGLYYHIDMNGGPWNDRWVNTSPLPKLREQLSLAYRTGLDRIWIINVGDLKPKEVPIHFIMDFAWDPEAIRPGDELPWLERFASATLGDPDIAPEAARLMALYPKYNLWRKPEVQVPGIFADNYGERARVDSLWSDLELRAERLRARVPQASQDAFFQLVYYPVMASAGVAHIYNAATEGDSLRIVRLMERDARLTACYNDTLAGGKWRGMMSDKHIGYTQWFMPEGNIHPLSIPRYRDPRLCQAALRRVESREYGIEAHHYARSVKGADAQWIFLPDLGRGEGCMGIDNVLAQSDTTCSGPALEYDIRCDADGPLTVALAVLPTQDVRPERGLRVALQLDGGTPRIIDARRGLVDTFSEYTPGNLAVSRVLKPLPEPGRLALNGYVDGRRMPMRSDVFDNLRWLDADFGSVSQGSHRLRVIMVDPEVVLERLVINPDPDCYSYFGAPERR